MNKPLVHNVYVRLAYRDTWEEAQEYATRIGVSMSMMMMLALREYLEDVRHRPEIRKEAM